MPTSRPVAINPVSPGGVSAGRCCEQGIEGRVLLRLYADSLGTLVPDSTRVAESSGYPALDSAALAGRAGAAVLAGAAARPARGRPVPPAGSLPQPALPERHAMTPPHLRAVRFGARDDRLDPAHPAGPGGRGHPDAGLRQGRVRQPRRIGEGPDRPRHHRGRGAAGRAPARRDHRRGDQRQHRRGAGDRRGAQGLPLRLHHARQDVAGEGAAAQGVRGGGGDHARPRCRRTIPTTT